MVTLKPQEAGLSRLLDIILDKGVTIDANTKVDFSGLELLGAKARVAMASFKTAHKVGLIFPESTNLNMQSWRDLVAKRSCPACGMESTHTELSEGCPWCGFNYRQIER
jgi:hypothetical protein